MCDKVVFLTLLILLVLFPITIINAQVVWEKDPFKVCLNDDIITLVHNDMKIVEIKAIAFNFIQPDTITVERIETDTVIFKLQFSQSDGFRMDFPQELLLKLTQYDHAFHFSAVHPAFRHITITMKDLNEHYFGLIEKLYPENLKNPDLRSNVVDVDVYSLGERDYAENYSSAYSAFYISSRGYGSFFDTFAKGRYQFAINGKTQIYHQTNTLDWYILFGPTGTMIHKQYFDIIGHPKFIPIWACGPIFWRDQNDGGKDEILDDIYKFTTLKIPLTACWVDRPYSNGAHEWSKMDFNDKFAAPEQWIRVINEQYGLRFMTWISPMTFADNNFPGLLPNYKRYIDLTNPEALKEFAQRLSGNQYSAGVAGHKMDRGDENFPFTAQWYEPVSESESRNKYVYLYSKIIDEFLTRAHNKDQFNFARAAVHRCQPYLSAIWGGDNRSNWQGMAGNEANAIRCGFMGFPVWGNDTGGYLGPGKIDEDLYIRWLQWSVWNGMFEIKIDGAGGSGEDRPPWKYLQHFQTIFRDLCEWRMELLPYIYSIANTSYINGVMMKPLAYLYPDDQNTYQIWDEFVFGNVFLVAPLFAKINQREIYLPEGTWYDFHNLTREYKGPVSLNQNVPLETIPVFIKENSIYLCGNIYQGNSRQWRVQQESSLTIHLFPGKKDSYTVFEYIDYLDNDKEKKMRLEHQAGKYIFTSDTLNIKSTIAIKCSKKPAKIVLNNESAEFNYTDSNKITKIKLEKDRKNRVEIYY